MGRTHYKPSYRGRIAGLRDITVRKISVIFGHFACALIGIYPSKLLLFLQYCKNCFLISSVHFWSESFHNTFAPIHEKFEIIRDFTKSHHYFSLA